MADYFENGFPYPVKVILRNGFAVTLPPHGNVGLNNLLTTRVYDFVVRRKISYSRHVKIDTNNILDGITEESNKELFAIALAANQRNSYSADTLHDFSVDYLVTKEQFEANVKTGLYVPEIDLLVVHPDANDVVHPYSPEGLSMMSNNSKELLGYFYRIEIVDPYDQLGPRFVNIAGKIDKIEPIKDVQRQPGVYIHRVMRSDPSKQAEITPEYYTFDDAVKVVRLYRSVDEAKTLGDLAESQKREFEKATHDQKMKILELEGLLKDESNRAKMAQAEFDKKKHELEETRELIKSLREERMAKLKEQAEVRSMAREDHYEQRAYTRKDDSEWLKWVPAVVVGGGLLAYKLFID